MPKYLQISLTIEQWQEVRNILKRSISESDSYPHPDLRYDRLKKIIDVLDLRLAREKN